jgi:hypothetical protein
MTGSGHESGGATERVVIPRQRGQWAMACAVWIEQNRGSAGPLYIADMIGQFAREGDAGGVATWREIAAAYEQLILRESCAFC